MLRGGVQGCTGAGAAGGSAPPHERGQRRKLGAAACDGWRVRHAPSMITPADGRLTGRAASCSRTVKSRHGNSQKSHLTAQRQGCSQGCTGSQTRTSGTDGRHRMSAAACRNYVLCFLPPSNGQLAACTEHVRVCCSVVGFQVSLPGTEAALLGNLPGNLLQSILI